MGAAGAGTGLGLGRAQKGTRYVLGAVVSMPMMFPVPASVGPGELGGTTENRVLFPLLRDPPPMSLPLGPGESFGEGGPQPASAPFLFKTGAVRCWDG